MILSLIVIQYLLFQIILFVSTLQMHSRTFPGRKSVRKRRALIQVVWHLSDMVDYASVVL